MTKHIYLKILWPYLVGVAILVIFSAFSGHFLNDFLDNITIIPLLFGWLFFSIPWIVSVVILILNYRHLTAAQKVVLVFVNAAFFALIAMDAVGYYNFISHPVLNMAL